MRFIILDSMPKFWLKLFFETQPELANAQTSQFEAVSGSQTAHLICALRNLGHEAIHIYGDCLPIQSLWLDENGLKADQAGWDPVLIRKSVARIRRVIGIPSPVIAQNLVKIWEAQLVAYRPDVVYCVGMQKFPPSYLELARKAGALLVGQIASEYDAARMFRVYDLVVSSLPNFVEEFTRNNVQAAYLPLGFGSEVLEQLDPTLGASVNRVLHIGGYGPVHQERNMILDKLAQAAILDCYGYAMERTPDDSPLRKVYQGPTFGMQVYQLRQSYSISVTKHISKVAGPYANNTTMFETTGVGGCLLVDERINLDDFFVPGKEVVTYRSAEECLEKARYLLDHPKERAAMAIAGQARTLREHTVLQRTEKLLEMVDHL